MKPEFQCHYFIRKTLDNDMGHHPFACVCLQGFKTDDGKWNFARGVSICSERDDFKKKLGFIKASEILSDGVEKTSCIRSGKLFGILNDIWTRTRLSLLVPNSAPVYDKNRRIVNNRYYKAKFGLSLHDLTKKEQEIVDGYLAVA